MNPTNIHRHPGHPGQPMQPPTPQGPPGHGQPMMASAPESTPWILKEDDVQLLPDFDTEVIAVPYKFETRIGKQSGIPYHVVSFKITEGPAKGYDKLDYIVSESESAKRRAFQFFAEVGYPIGSWKEEHKNLGKKALEYIVQQRKPVYILVTLREGENSRQYREIGKMRPAFEGTL